MFSRPKKQKNPGLYESVSSFLQPLLHSTISLHSPLLCNMDSDLDALIDNAGAKRSKRPRARGLTTSQPGKSSKRSRKTPPPPPPASSSAAASTGQTNVPTTIPPSQAVVSVVAPASQTDIAAVVESQPPVAGQMPST
ncbi:uncharacterized protein LOC133793769 [Humulus lupulus]|uniref:uncharacterized protein LOC133793769 n=1 Tax=Humulus lupulus TaxID=3486 RepID=UPI002B4005A2|nr:uncharacterized protein LOC133793769 [Humulus lupulus]